MKKLLTFMYIIMICFIATPVFAETVDCGVIADITGPAARIIMIAGPVLLVVMGAVDILKVVTSGDEKDMRKALDNGDIEQACSNAHALKGVMGNLGITPLFKLYSDINMLLKADKDPQSLIDMVTSKGGTTFELLGVLNKHDFDAVMHEAFIACENRAKELSL